MDPASRSRRSKARSEIERHSSCSPQGVEHERRPARDLMRAGATTGMGPTTANRTFCSDRPESVQARLGPRQKGRKHPLPAALHVHRKSCELFPDIAIPPRAGEENSRTTLSFWNHPCGAREHSVRVRTQMICRNCTVPFTLALSFTEACVRLRPIQSLKA